MRESMGNALQPLEKIALLIIYLQIFRYIFDDANVACDTTFIFILFKKRT